MVFLECRWFICPMLEKRGEGIMKSTFFFSGMPNPLLSTKESLQSSTEKLLGCLNLSHFFLLRILVVIYPYSF